MHVISSNHFEWDSARQWFFADISVLKLAGFNLYNKEVIRERSLTGFWMKSERTGKELWFTQGNIERDDDGNVLYWNFTAFNLASNSYVYLRIFND